MKKILSIIGGISFIIIKSSNLIGCGGSNIIIPCKKINQGNWKQQCFNDKPFNIWDNKYYFVLWRGDENDVWNITKFKNKKFNQLMNIYTGMSYDLYLFKLSWKNFVSLGISKHGEINGISIWGEHNKWNTKHYNTYFKSIYRWDGQGDTSEPKINKNTGEIINWNI